MREGQGPAMIRRIGDIDLDQNLDHERREWRVQRVGRVLLGFVVVAALLGLFGDGPLADAQVGGAADGLTVRYSRFVRQLGERELVIDIPGDPARGDRVELWIDRAYIDRINISDVEPVPESVREGSGRLVFILQLRDPGASLRVRIDYTPKHVGRLRGRVGVGDDNGVSFTQFIYP